MRYTTQRSHEQGFTLVELAIVLVIIGLIIGGVLVGQDLIRAAEIRASAGQIEKYNTAVNTFRTKYNSIPGDIRDPGSYNLDNAVLGNGDRSLQDTTGNMTNMDGELTKFWRHLSQANLVDGSYDGLQTAAALGTTVPRGKIDRKGVGVYSNAGYNYYQIGADSSAAASAVAVYANGLTPLEANNIDQKVDDGAPNTGQTIARGGVVANAAAVIAAGVTQCATGAATTDTYATTQTGVNCQVRLRMQ